MNLPHHATAVQKNLCHEGTEHDPVEVGRGDISEEGKSELSSVGAEQSDLVPCRLADREVVTKGQEGAWCSQVLKGDENMC